MQFCRFDKRTPPPTFSDTAITDRHSDTGPLFSSSELTGCGYPGLLDRKNRSDMCPRWESSPRLSACKASTLSTRPGSPQPVNFIFCMFLYLTDSLSEIYSDIFPVHHWVSISHYACSLLVTSVVVEINMTGLY